MLGQTAILIESLKNDEKAACQKKSARTATGHHPAAIFQRLLTSRINSPPVFVAAIFSAFVSFNCLPAIADDAPIAIGHGKIGVGTKSPVTEMQVVGTVTATTFSGNGAGLAGIVTAIGTCATASDIAAKTVAVSNFSLVAGVNVLVIFTSSNSAASPTLNVNSTGDIAIYHEDGNAASATYPAYFPAGAEIEFYYDGAYWRFKQRVVTNYISGARWYRVYSDGWIEQGDSASTLDTAITFSKPFRDTNYTLLNVSFVIANYGAQYVVKYVSYFTTWSAVNTAGTYSWEAKGY